MNNSKEEDLINENKVIQDLCECSDSYTSVVFNAGAGAGKTYALIQCLKHIIISQGEKLKNHNQKIACITYTNVAAEHIMQQLGSSDVVEVSTIHKRIWDIICNQKTALLKLHTERLCHEVVAIDKELEEKDDYKKYQKLSVDEKEYLFNLMLDKKKLYNSVYNQKAKDFKENMPKEIKENYGELLSNVANFKGVMDKLFRRKRYKDCLEKIKAGDPKYQIVYYDAMYNQDRLDKMRISHDTLLEYGYQMIENYPRLRQIVIDYYPYVLIDEYQDTADIVVKIMNTIEQYAKEINHNMFIGYFGDSVQNIYEDGVGKKLIELHPELKKISKEYNRRSYREIIDVANKIRNDDIKQRSIYSDSTGGVVELYYGNQEDVKRFVDKCVEDWGINNDNALHCIMATNKMVAEYSGFLTVYSAYKDTENYKGANFEQLNTELLSHDTVHLGITQALLFRLMRLYTQVRDEMQPLRDILPTDQYRYMGFLELKSLINTLKSIEGSTLDELFMIIFQEYTNSDSGVFRLIVERVFDIEEMTYDGVLKFFLTALYTSVEEQNDERETKEIIRNILSLKIVDLLNWYHYVNRDEKKDISYHTFHSTKGLEYQNVAIILEKQFGRGKNIFEIFFKEYNEPVEQDLEQFEKGRNILYVAVTRAIKNLRILYVDDTNEIQDNMEKIFGKAKELIRE